MSREDANLEFSKTKKDIDAICACAYVCVCVCVCVCVTVSQCVCVYDRERIFSGGANLKCLVMRELSRVS